MFKVISDSRVLIVSVVVLNSIIDWVVIFWRVNVVIVLIFVSRMMLSFC